MQRPAFLDALARAMIVAVAVGVLSAGLAACGQRGPLYYPDKENPDKRR
jgi:predicted small lipoprotein YifL